MQRSRAVHQVFLAELALLQYSAFAAARTSLGVTMDEAFVARLLPNLTPPPVPNAYVSLPH